MKNREIILASKSLRRKELLESVGLSFAIHTKEIEEIFDSSLCKEKAIEKIAFDKANSIYCDFRDAIVLGADTMVCYKDEILGKPKNRDDGYRMLSMLSGKTHEVISAVVMLCKEKQIVFHVSTLVTFYDLDEKTINDYLDTGEPFDKAGAYGIQGKGKLLVKEIQGDYYNVMGLPVAKVFREIQNLQK